MRGEESRWMDEMLVCRVMRMVDCRSKRVEIPLKLKEDRETEVSVSAE